ncbi:MAG TPA: rhomboid family intramembrane serine protease [Pyrinomonadaceae bacterium]|nr:rhomboid family intramembrane serine protease [Pyrinomonadaceae bacterium]
MQCAVCGASTVPQHQSGQPQVDRETIRFARAVLNRPYKFTIIILIANLFVFLLMWQSSGLTSQVLWNGFSEPVLEAYGAKLNALIQAGQWWRFVTPMFIHVNLPHLLVNMYSLWVVGPYVERLYGSAKFVVFWVLTGIAGVVGSYLTVRPSMPGSFFGRFFFKAHDVPSAGASGALFGLVGVLFVFGIKFRHELPEGFKRAFGTGMLPIIFINLFIGYIGRGVIDNAAHVGGLLSGAALALVVQYRRPGERKGVEVIWRILQVAALGLVAVGFFFVARHLNLPPPAQVQNVQIRVENPSFLIYANAMNQAQEALGQVLHDSDASGIDASLKALDGAPPLDPNADELKLRLKDLLVRAKTQASRPADAATQKDKSRLVQDVDVWSKEYGEWLKSKMENVPAPNTNQ